MSTHHDWLGISNRECLIKSDTPHFDSAADKASRTSRLLPTPATPETTTPEPSDASIAASIVRNCSERPINGHDKRTIEA